MSKALVQERLRALRRRLLRWDNALTGRLKLLAVPGETRLQERLATGIAHSGDSILWLVGAILALLLGKGAWPEGGQRVLLATFVGGGAVWLLKLLFRRRRPSNGTQGLYLSLDVHSFPSGHAGRNACYVVLLWPLLSLPVQIGSLAWLSLLGLSRVALGIHYLSDVLAGFVVGGTIGWWIDRLLPPLVT